MQLFYIIKLLPITDVIIYDFRRYVEFNLKKSFKE